MYILAQARQVHLSVTVDNDQLPAEGNNTTYSEFTGENTHEVEANDFIFFQNNGSGGIPDTTGLRAGRLEGTYGNDIWDSHGATQTAYRNDTNGGDGVPPDVVGTSSSGGKAFGIKVTYTG